MSKFLLAPAAAVAILVAGLGSSVAFAADMPVKAVKAPAVEPLDVHGYVDLTIANTRVSNGGSVFYPYRGMLTQIETGVSLDLYKNPTGFINKVSVFGGIWNEFWSTPNPPFSAASNLQETDWWVGGSVGFAQRWTFSLSYVEFRLAGGGPTAYNVDYNLSYADGGFGILPFSVNPYIDVFQNAGGFNLVPSGNNSYRVELGVKPTYSFEKTTGLPLTFTFPTHVTLAPTSYWNRGVNVCGTTLAAACSDGAAGVFSTGIQAKYMLTAIIPPRLGAWYIKAGLQWHHLFNDSLLAAQVTYGSANNWADTKSDWLVASTGIGFSF